MKKSLATLVAGALVVGAASTAFAAANPFSDVPRGHWAYDAVAQLARDGVINGYGDTSFRGDRNITRYEMAQMIAKAMAKQPKSGNDKALLDKLVAEFRDELDNLGVRVAKLEKHADMVKWNGELRYTYTSSRYGLVDSLNKMVEEARGYKNAFGKSKKNSDVLLFRLEPTAEVSEHWSVKARIDAGNNMKTDSSTNVKLKRAWAEGKYGKFTAKFGKLPMTVDSDLLFFDEYSGAQLEYGKDFKFTLGAGRWNMERASGGDMVDSLLSETNSGASYGIGSISDIKNVMGAQGISFGNVTANYQVVGLQYDNGKKFYGGFGFHHLSSTIFALSDKNKLKDVVANRKLKKADAYIWALNAGYRFDKNVKLGANYARNTKADSSIGPADLGSSNTTHLVSANQAYSIQLSYKGAQKENRGTWGVYAAYRHLGPFVALDPSYDGIKYGEKGWEFGLNYTPFKNVVTTLKYAQGKALADGVDDNKVKRLWARVQMFF